MRCAICNIAKKNNVHIHNCTYPLQCWLSFHGDEVLKVYKTTYCMNEDTYTSLNLYGRKGLRDIIPKQCAKNKTKADYNT